MTVLSTANRAAGVAQGAEVQRPGDREPARVVHGVADHRPVDL